MGVVNSIILSSFMALTALKTKFSEQFGRLNSFSSCDNFVVV